MRQPVRRPVRHLGVLVLVACLPALASTSCQTARVGARCSAAQGAARNDTHVLFCVKGRWKATVTIGQAAGIIVSTLPGSLDPQPHVTAGMSVYSGSPLGAKIGVILEDRGGRPMVDRAVSFSWSPVGARFDVGDLPATALARTNVNGFALVPADLVVGPVFGDLVVTASADGVASVALPTLRVVGRTPYTVTDVSGQDQVVAAGAMPAPVVVAVTDVRGDPAWGSVATIEDVGTGFGVDPDDVVIDESRGLITIQLPPSDDPGSYDMQLVVTARADQPGAHFDVAHQLRWTVSG